MKPITDTTPEDYRGMYLYGDASGIWHARERISKKKTGDYVFRDSVTYRPINWVSKIEAKTWIDNNSASISITH